MRAVGAYFTVCDDGREEMSYKTPPGLFSNRDWITDHSKSVKSSVPCRLLGRA
jgi:hypothetical protein